MTSPQRKGTLWYVTSCGFCTLVLTFAQPFLQSYAQSPPCPTIQQTGAANAWAQNANVTVDIDSAFSSAQRACIETGIRSWQSSNGASGNASGVRVNFTVGLPKRE